MTIKQPSPFFRAMILGAQGVFFNLFFLAYLVSPKSAHRFVGYLEEEACLTYTLCLEEMDKGRLPEWKEMPAPAIAIVSRPGTEYGDARSQLIRSGPRRTIGGYPRNRRCRTSSSPSGRTRALTGSSTIHTPVWIKSEISVRSR